MRATPPVTPRRDLDVDTADAVDGVQRLDTDP